MNYSLTLIKNYYPFNTPFLYFNVPISDNKYVQFRLMHPLDNASTAVADFTNPSNWQGVDAEPTATSKNLVESGGVYLIKRGLDDVVNGVSVNYIPNKIVNADYSITDNEGTIVSVELTNVLGKTIQYISNEGYIAYYNSDGTGYQRYLAQGNRTLTIPGSDTIHHVVATFDAANSTFGIKEGDEWLYYPSGVPTNSLIDTQVMLAIMGDALMYSHIVYDDSKNIISADIVYPDGVKGTITNVVVTNDIVQSMDYTYGIDTTYRYFATYDSNNNVVSTEIQKIIN